MLVHPAIAALRADPDSQRRSQARMGRARLEWRCRSGVDVLEGELVRYAAGAELDGLEQLSCLLRDPAAAQDFVCGLVDVFVEALIEEPLGEVPFSHGSSEFHARLNLLETVGAALSLCAYETGLPAGDPDSVQFVDCETVALVLRGSARGRIYHLGDPSARAKITSEPVIWSPDDQTRCRPYRDTRHIAEIQETMLVLQLTRAPQRARPTLEYRLSDGELVGQASGDRAASEQLMAVAVLGALGDPCGLDGMEHFALQTSNDRDARWEAMRQVLAMDSMRGFKLLCGLRGREDDPLCDPARDLMERLLEAYPVLRDRNLEKV